MKKILSLTAVLSIVLGLTSFGENIPQASLPISSKAAITAYANGQVARGYISHGGTTVLQDGEGFTFIEHVSADIADVLKGISAPSASFDVANTKDPIYTWVNIVNKDWETLYYGSRSAPPEKVGSNWKLSSQGVQLQLADYIPLPFKGALYGQLIIRDDDGNVIDSRYLEAGDDKLYFQTALAGWGTELIVTYRNGSGFNSIAYSVPNGGEAIIPSHITGATTVWIENQMHYSDQSVPASVQTVSLTIVSGYNQQGTSGSPLLHLKLATARRMVISASAFSNDTANVVPYVAPSKFTFYQFENGQLMDEFEVDAVSGGINVQLPAGTYEITPDFGDLFESKTLPPSWYGGGKG